MKNEKLLLFIILFGWLVMIAENANAFVISESNISNGNTLYLSMDNNITTDLSPIASNCTNAGNVSKLNNTLINNVILGNGTTFPFSGFNNRQNTYLSCGARSITSIRHTQSMLVWLNTTPATLDGEYLTDFSLGAGNVMSLQVGGNGNKWKFVVYSGTTISTDYLFNTTNNWIFVTVTSDEIGNAKLYINGTLNISGNIGTNSANSLSIGRWGGDTTYNFGGNLDEVAVWDRELGADEVMNLYRNLTLGFTLYENYSTPLDDIYPSANISINNTLLSNGIHINVTGNSSDNIGLSYCMIIINQTGSNQFFNFSLNDAVYGYCGQNITVIGTIGNIINFTLIVNDTSNNIVQSNVIISIDDIAPPTILNISTQNITSFYTTDKVNITATIADNSGFIASAKLYINKSDVLTEYSLTHIGNNIYQINPVDVFALGAYNIAYINATDGSTNKAQENSTISFTVSSPPSGNGITTGGGGGVELKIIKLQNQNLTQLFFGFTEFSFFVISTPSTQVKLIKFQNIGNNTFQDAKVSVLGNANKFIQASVCDINNTISCLKERINIPAGENRFLKLEGNFTKELDLGSEGLVRFESLAELEEKGKTVDLLISINRPPAYNLIINPISSLNAYERFLGDNELPALAIGYSLTLSVLFGSFYIIRGLL